LLQLDENVDKKRLATFPLARYAARYWVDHARFEDVVSQIQDAMERLFSPRNPFLSAWVWIHDVDSGHFSMSIDALKERPSRPGATALYYAVLCGFSGLVNYLISTHAEDVNARCGRRETLLHAASYEGHLDVAGLLLDHGADVNMKNARKVTPLHSAYAAGHVEVIRLLLDHGADADVPYLEQPLLNHASSNGHVEVVHLLLQHNADVNRTSYGINWTALHWASSRGHPKIVKLLLVHGAEINALSEAHNTPLRLASYKGHLEVVKILLEHGADVHIRGEGNETPFQTATSGNHTEVAQLLLEHGAEKEC
jgi:ankyrin repeat protein